MSIETAVIPVAGSGSRLFPQTTAIEKCMLPVYAGNEARPLIDYMVEDCANAGLRRIIIVTTDRGKQQLQDYYGPELTPTLQAQLRRVGKSRTIDTEHARRRQRGLKIEYLIQPPDEYGTAVPPHLARTLLEGEKHFALMGGDDFVYHADGTSELGLAIAGWERSGADHAIMGLPIPRTDAPKYGIMHTADVASRILTGIEEKPQDISKLPEHPVANISRYILNDSIWDFIEAEMHEWRGTGEHYITYPIAAAIAAGHQFYVHPVQGTYLDGGSAEGLRIASEYLTQHPRTSPQ